MTQPSSDFETASFRAIVDAIPDMIIRIGRDHTFRSFEGKINELFRPEVDYLGKRIEDVLPENTAPRFVNTLESVFATGEVQSIEYSLTFEQTICYYEARLVKSTVDEAIAVVRNVTHQKETEEQLHEYQFHLEHQMAIRSADLSAAENRYRNIFHHSGAPSIIVEQDFTISMANPKFEELTGFSCKEIENRMKWTDFIDPEDRQMVIRYHFSRRSGEGAAPPEYECRIIDRNQSVKIIFIKVGMLSETGRSIASIIDITSLKNTEHDLRDRETLYSAILEGYEGFVYFIDRKYRIRFMNENLIRNTGIDATGTLCHESLHGRASPCLWCVAEQVFEGNRVRFEMKNPKDKKWYYSINVPVRLSDQSVFCQAMITDIDERKRMEESLRDSEAHLRDENIRLRTTIEERQRFGDIVGKSPAMQEVYELMLMAAASDTNVILYGESGTGKELVARAIHGMSARQNRNFVPVNSGAIPENLLESEFFGHKKGAFTGAGADKKGLLDEADQGTLFLDEIGEIKPDLQVKLLRAIEGGGFTPVGSSQIKKPDFRIVAATSRNLSELVKAGRMRSDFFYRVHVIPIHLPPLRKRKEDIPLLAEHFFKAYDSNIRPVLTSKIMDTLMNHNWPGNVRELQNVLYRFVTLKRLDLAGESPMPAEDPLAETSYPATSLPDTVASFEKRQIAAALAEHRWNRTRTAKTLGIGLRTLQRKMKFHQIH
ncbi:sigma 54-interacting transcriptional regulator [uncultured Desulfosarcina sp.]|uniref:sigma 54-interacting transcriptional regulator n=1 Tax=uncultured Desulfosarcina sp. TaxID=218289 RepID=UPI0029C73BE4|nr:sigma 54-interacting transcriptional regulator [uncultured Desulfosarcina sp.]